MTWNGLTNPVHIMDSDMRKPKVMHRNVNHSIVLTKEFREDDGNGENGCYPGDKKNCAPENFELEMWVREKVCEQQSKNCLWNE